MDELWGWQKSLAIVGVNQIVLLFSFTHVQGAIKHHFSLVVENGG